MPSSRRVLGGIVVWAVLAIPGVWFGLIPREWDARGVSHVSGDEPHYLIIADAIAKDHTVRVKPAYDRDALTSDIYGPVDWEKHTRTGPAGTFSLHGIGLGAFVAPGFALFGLPGARMTLAAFAGLIPFLFFGIARQAGIGRPSAVAVALAAAFSLPFLAASGQIFPDLPTGVLLLGLTFALFDGACRGASPRVLLLAAAMLAVLPWLHVKNVLPMMVFASAFLALAVRKHPGPVAIRRGACILLPVAVSVALLVSYNIVAFGAPGGPYSSTDAGATVRQAAMIAIGLHLDQAQGLFIQQPLFLLAVAGLPLFLRRNPFVAWTMMAAYVAVIVPNAVHPCWYGCASFSGRFMWSVAALWFLPLVVLFRELRLSERIAAAILGGLTLWWQVLLMNRWRLDPPSLYTRLSDSLVERNGLFELEWRRYFPSFYDFDRYAGGTTNILALVLVLGMLAVGVWLAAGRRGSKSGQGRQVLVPVLAPLGAVVVAVLVAHAAPPAPIDLLGTFSGAELRPRGAGPETFALRAGTINGDTKQAIFAHPPSRITWVLTLPQDAKLEAWVGIDPDAWDRDGDGVLFRVGISDEGGYTELLNRHVNPRASAGDRRWIAVNVDLSPYGGKEVSVIFNTNTGPPGTNDSRNDLAYWAAPRIRTY